MHLGMKDTFPRSLFFAASFPTLPLLPLPTSGVVKKADHCGLSPVCHMGHHICLACLVPFFVLFHHLCLCHSHLLSCQHCFCSHSCACLRDRLLPFTPLLLVASCSYTSVNEVIAVLYSFFCIDAASQRPCSLRRPLLSAELWLVAAATPQLVRLVATRAAAP